MKHEDYVINGQNGLNVQIEVLRVVGQALFAERQRRNLKLATVSACLDVRQELVDMAETGTGKAQWAIISKLLKYYNKRFDIQLVSPQTEG